MPLARNGVSWEVFSGVDVSKVWGDSEVCCINFQPKIADPVESLQNIYNDSIDWLIQNIGRRI